MKWLAQNKSSAASALKAAGCCKVSLPGPDDSSSFSPPDRRHQLTMTKVIYSLLMATDNSGMCSLIASGALPLPPAGQQTGTNHPVEGEAYRLLQCRTGRPHVLARGSSFDFTSCTTNLGALFKWGGGSKYPLSNVLSGNQMRQSLSHSVFTRDWDPAKDCAGAKQVLSGRRPVWLCNVYFHHYYYYSSAVNKLLNYTHQIIKWSARRSKK